MERICSANTNNIICVCAHIVRTVSARIMRGIIYPASFLGKVKPTNRLMNRLSSSAKVIREGTVNWSFEDNYGITQ